MTPESLLRNLLLLGLYYSCISNSFLLMLKKITQTLTDVSRKTMTVLHTSLVNCLMSKSIIAATGFYLLGAYLGWILLGIIMEEEG